MTLSADATGRRVKKTSFVALGPTYSLRHVINKAIADIFIILCAYIMLWRSWLVNKWVMVPWKCECPLMKFTWYVMSHFKDMHVP